MRDKNIFRNILISIFFCANFALATITSYGYSTALLKQRSVDGINVKVSKELTLFLSRADWYRHIPYTDNYTVEWWGYDYNVGLNYKLLTLGPISAVAGINEMILLRRAIYREHRERANLNLNANFGPMSFGINSTLENRQYQTDVKYKKIRSRFLFKVASSKGFTKLQITPFASWETFYQKRDALDISNGDAYEYREAEVGFTSKLSDKISIGISDAFEYYPKESNTNRNARSAHRVSTTFFYNVDLSK